MIQLEFITNLAGQPGFAGIQDGAPISTKKATEYFLNMGINELRKKITATEDRGALLRVALFRVVLLKGTTKKFMNQNRGFLCSLMRIDLPLMKNIPTILAKNVFLSLGKTTATIVIDAAIQRKGFGSGMPTLII